MGHPQDRPSRNWLIIAACAAAIFLALAVLSAPTNATAKKKHGAKQQAPALIFSDTGTAPDPAPLWGKIDCENAARAQQINAGGDTHLTATGAPQGDSAFRRLSVIDGDDVYGERCELGEDYRAEGPTVLYRQGRHRLTALSVRLPSTFPLNVFTWQVVMQMKHLPGGQQQRDTGARAGRLRRPLGAAAEPLARTRVGFARALVRAGTGELLDALCLRRSLLGSQEEGLHQSGGRSERGRRLRRS